MEEASTGALTGPAHTSARTRNENMLAMNPTPDTYTLLQQAIAHLEEKSKPSEGTYVKYENKIYEKFPTYTTVLSKPITFFGATRSVIKAREFDKSPPLSGRYIYSVGPSGTTN